MVKHLGWGSIHDSQSKEGELNEAEFGKGSGMEILPHFHGAKRLLGTPFWLYGSIAR